MTMRLHKNDLNESLTLLFPVSWEPDGKYYMYTHRDQIPLSEAEDGQLYTLSHADWATSLAVKKGNYFYYVEDYNWTTNEYREFHSYVEALGCLEAMNFMSL